jgi:hypothetical protein
VYTPLLSHAIFSRKEKVCVSVSDVLAAVVFATGAGFRASFEFLWTKIQAPAELPVFAPHQQQLNYLEGAFFPFAAVCRDWPTSRGGQNAKISPSTRLFKQNGRFESVCAAAFIGVLRLIRLPAGYRATVKPDAKTELNVK